MKCLMSGSCLIFHLFQDGSPSLLRARTPSTHRPRRAAQASAACGPTRVGARFTGNITRAPSQRGGPQKPENDLPTEPELRGLRGTWEEPFVLQGKTPGKVRTSASHAPLSNGVASLRQHRCTYTSKRPPRAHRAAALHSQLLLQTRTAGYRTEHCR